MKNIKLSDCMDNIDPVQLDNIEMNEKIGDRVSTERIKQIVLNAINVQIDSPDTRKKDKRMKRMKPVILLAAVVLVLSTSVYAISSLGAFEMFFPEGVKVIEGETQNVFAKTQQNGVTLTIEKAVNDGRSGVISYSFSKNDGSAFDEGTVVGKIKLSESESLSYEEGELVENNKKIVGYIIPHNDNKLITENNLTLSITNLVTVNAGMKVVDVNLKKLMHSSPSTHMELLPDLVPGFTLDEVKIVNGKLNFQTTLPIANPPRDISANIGCLKNIKTGETIYSNNEGNFDIAGDTVLSDLKPVAFYSVKKVVVPGTWNVSIKLESSDNLVSKDVNITIAREKKNIVITNVCASILGVYVKGYVENKDGTKVLLTEKAFEEDKFNQIYVLLRNGQKQNITFFTAEEGFENDGDKNYKILRKYYYDLYTKDEYINTPISSRKARRTFIDSNNVSSVVIDGVEILLK